VFVALIKKHSDYGRPIQKQVSFAKREIMRMVGRREWGGRDSEELSRALHQIHHTFIKTHFKGRTGRYTEHSFNIFPELLIERREFASDPIEACTITLAEPIIASLQDEHFTCLNHRLMRDLGTIGQALYMRLFFHFANLYDGRNGSRLAFPKRYDDICAEWLGGLTVLSHRSKIIGEQLGRHLDQLIDAGFLAAYAIEPAKTRAGFVITFKPGRTFFDDYDRFYRSRQGSTTSATVHTDSRTIGEPIRVAYLFTEKRTGRPADKVAFVSPKEVETAKQLLAHIAFDEMPEFLEYALAQAATTNFDVQTLGGLKQYVTGYLATRERRTAARAAETARKAKGQEQELRTAYDHYRYTEAGRIFSQLPKARQGVIEAEAHRYGMTFTGSLRPRMTETRKRMLTAERYDNRIQSFDQWSATRRAD
jgi:Replication initiator protein A